MNDRLKAWIGFNDGNCDEDTQLLINDIKELEKKLAEAVEMLNQACDEMLFCNKDSQANYYFDSCGWILTFLQENNIRESKA